MHLTSCTKTYSGIDALTEKARGRASRRRRGYDRPAIRRDERGGQRGAGLVYLRGRVSGAYVPSHGGDPERRDRYTFVQTYKPLDGPSDIAVLSWKRGLSFVINNTACTSVKLTTANGTQEENIEDNAYPYVFYCPEIPSEYVFLDADRNEL